MASMTVDYRKFLPFVFACLLLSMAFLTVTGPAKAQTQPTGWYQQNSGATGEITSVSAVDTMTAWAACPTGILKTVDGGATWVNQTPGNNSCRSVSAVDSLVAWSTLNGNICRTMDGGATWQTIKATSFYTVHQWAAAVFVDAVDSNIAWAVCIAGGNGLGQVISGWSILKTEDAGATWTSQPMDSYYNLYWPPAVPVSAMNGKEAWVGGSIANPAYQYCPGIRITADGTDWSTQFEADTNGVISKIALVNPNEAWAFGGFDQLAGTVIMHTGDGGVGWETQASHSTSILMSGTAVSSRVAWGVGDAGMIVKTADGRNWGPQVSGVTTQLDDISAVDANTAWAVGYGGVILHTVDGGGAIGAVPEVQSVTGTQTSSGTELTIRGSGFGADRGSSTVGLNRATGWSYGYASPYFVPDSFSYISWSDSEIHCLDTTNLPGPIYVTVKIGNLISGRQLFVFEPATGVVSIEPHSAATGVVRTVTLNGFGFNAPNFTLGFTNSDTGTPVPVSEVTVESPTRLTCKLDLTGLAPGKYDVNVSGDWASFPYKKGFTVRAPVLTGVTPTSGTNMGPVQATISGRGFVPGATVRLEQGTNTISGKAVSVPSDSTIRCVFDLAGKPMGKYDLVVQLPGQPEMRLTAAFSVTNICGQGAGTVAVGFGLMMGLLSLGGSGLLRRRHGRKSR